MNKLNTKNIFLLDAIGASLSLLLTGLILPNFSMLIGISIKSLYFLALFPLMYLVYSFGIYFFVNHTKKWMILLIIFANLFYCLVSGLVILKTETVTIWGKLLLALEVCVVLVVVFLEYLVFFIKPKKQENKK